ncbi:MAG TPA: hypothetical protein VLZ11_08210 [Flavobacterium sp.]|nr:hypothetical protein [Flavobacterium sp.]
MAYSEIEQSTLDLDLFLKDKNKHIHIASGGGKIPNRLANSDNVIEKFKSLVINLEDNFEIDINPELTQILNLEENGIQSYLNDFVKYAKQGFYSYDKTKLGDFDDMTFHLVAKPRNGRLKLVKDFDILYSENILPESFQTFKLNEYIE